MILLITTIHDASFTSASPVPLPPAPVGALHPSRTEWSIGGKTAGRIGNEAKCSARDLILELVRQGSEELDEWYLHSTPCSAITITSS